LDDVVNAEQLQAEEDTDAADSRRAELIEQRDIDNELLDHEERLAALNAQEPSLVSQATPVPLLPDADDASIPLDITSPTLSPHTQSPTAQGPPDTAPTAATRFQYMRAFDPQANALNKAGAPLSPAVDVDHLCRKWERVDWLSTSTQGHNPGPLAVEAKEVEVQTTEEWLTERTAATHLTPETWKAACQFFDFDPSNHDARSSVYYSGWNADKPLKAYQFFTVAHVIRHIMSGRKVMIMALAMGLGKTAMGLAVLDILSGVQRRHDTARNANVMPPTRPFDVQALVGKPPVYRRGLTMILVPVKIMSQWAKERRSFITRKLPRMVLAYGKPTREVMEADYPGCMTLSDVVPRTEWAPEVSRYWSAERLTAYDKAGGIPVFQYLRANNDGSAREWHSRWWVLSSIESVQNHVKLTSDTEQRVRGKLDGCWSVVMLDEFHRTKTISARPWSTLAQLPGCPRVIGMSATPYTRTKDIAAITTAPYLQYCHGKNSNATLRNITPGRFATDWVLDGDLNTRQHASVLTNSFITMDKPTTLIDSYIDKITMGSTGPAGPVSGRLRLSEDQENAVEEFSKFIVPQMIQFGPDFVWQPDPSGTGMPAVDIPPHSAFDFFIDIEERPEKDPLEEYYRTQSIAEDVSYLSLIPKMRTYLLFPSLFTLMRENEDLSNELGEFTTKEAKAIATGTQASASSGTLHTPHNQSALWEVMSHIHASKAMTLVRAMITQLRSQRNAFDQGKKIVIAAYKPINAVIFLLYVEWLVQLPEYTALSSPQDYVFIDTWSSAERNRNRVNRFTTSNPDPDGYCDAPFLLIAIGSQISVGVNLPPAEVVITIDGEYNPTLDIQISGRVRRNTAIQKAPHTESYRIICHSSFCHINTWQCDRNATRSQIIKLIQAERNTALAKAPVVAQVPTTSSSAQQTGPSEVEGESSTAAPTSQGPLPEGV